MLKTKEEAVNYFLDRFIDCPYRAYQTDIQKEHVTEENNGLMFDVTLEFEHHKFIHVIFYDINCDTYNLMGMIEVVDHGVTPPSMH